MTAAPPCPRCLGIELREIARITAPYIWRGQLKYASIMPVPVPCECAFKRQMQLEAERPRPA